MTRTTKTLLGLALLLAATAPLPAAGPAAPASFATPKEAAAAFVAAAAADDVAALLNLLGPDGKDLVVSADPVKDRNNLAKFAELAKEKLELAIVNGTPNRVEMLVGDDAWPLPIPIVMTDHVWRFDAKAGRHEILVRRIGANELDAIALLRGYVDAQEEYVAENHGGAVRAYAQKWVSSPGKQDGLSWRDANGAPAGPLGDEIAEALAAGYKDKGAPYNGYYFRTLTGQGANARLGARDYVVNGQMIGGFAAIAWPAQYGVTGVQTFLVNNDGNVYQKDLGPQTDTLAPKMKLYDPDRTWTVTHDAD